MWQACIFWTCNCYKTRIEWKINSLIRRKKNRDILRYKFRIAIRYKIFVYCDILIYRHIVTPLVGPGKFLPISIPEMGYEAEILTGFFKSFKVLLYSYLYLCYIYMYMHQILVTVCTSWFSLYKWIVIPPRNEVKGGILESPCPGCPSVRLLSAFGFPWKWFPAHKATVFIFLV